MVPVHGICTFCVMADHCDKIEYSYSVLTPKLSRVLVRFSRRNYFSSVHTCDNKMYVSYVLEKSLSFITLIRRHGVPSIPINSSSVQLTPCLRLHDDYRDS